MGGGEVWGSVRADAPLDKAKKCARQVNHEVNKIAALVERLGLQVELLRIYTRGASTWVVRNNENRSPAIVVRLSGTEIRQQRDSSCCDDCTRVSYPLHPS